MGFRAMLGAGIDAREAKKGAADFNAAHRSMVDQAKRGNQQMGESMSRMRGQMLALAGAFGVTFGVAGAAQMVRGIINVSREFEQLKKRLEGATGSAQQADRAWAFVKKFADNAPGDIAQ